MLIQHHTKMNYLYLLTCCPTCNCLCPTALTPAGMRAKPCELLLESDRQSSSTTPMLGLIMCIFFLEKGTRGIFTRWAEKFRQVRCPTVSKFPLNSTAPMKIQPNVVNRKGINLAPWWGQSCSHWKGDVLHFSLRGGCAAFFSKRGCAVLSLGSVLLHGSADPFQPPRLLFLSIALTPAAPPHFFLVIAVLLPRRLVVLVCWPRTLRPQ
jgi:hypothetical protein